jgi:sorbitol-specific phosphotransferase system component IIA
MAMLMVRGIAAVAEDHFVVTWTARSAADMTEICLFHRPPFSRTAYSDVNKLFER